MYVVLTDVEPAAVTSLTGIGTGERCIVLGIDSILTCTYTGVPAPLILWFKISNGTRLYISPSDTKYVITHIPSTQSTELTIRNVTSELEDAGIYGCEAIDSLSGARSKSLKGFVICSNQASQPNN